MRLLRINTDSLELVDFPGRAPPYVILSHTWGDGEVTLQDLQQPDPGYRSKPGFSKLRGCCDQAMENGFRFVWIDTCCIDKTNSVELSEAINSMYQWYRNAHICYAYLADVPTSETVVEAFKQAPEFDKVGYFKNSRWFKRGWTLQELIAPVIVELYAADWSEIGTKSTLRAEIAAITGIDSEVLRGDKSPLSCSVAMRMGWAATRSTTRVEDRAYSLFGIFDVNMPLIYGEGNKAFLRLQEEIMRNTEDYSILAWGLWSTTPWLYPESKVPIGPDIQQWEHCNPLAVSPNQFEVTPAPMRSLRDFVYDGLNHWASPLRQGHPLTPTPKTNNYDPPTVTARGLSLSLPLFALGGQGGLWLAYIGCNLEERAVCMPLQISNISTNVFYRLTRTDRVYTYVKSELLSEFEMTRIYLRQQAKGYPPNHEERIVEDANRYWRTVTVSVRDLRHCNQWKEKQCCEDGSCYLKCQFQPRFRFHDDYAHYICFTDDGELFAIVLGIKGAGILWLGSIDKSSRSLTAKQILRGKLDKETRKFMAEREQAALISTQKEIQERVTQHFSNCAITITMKRGPYGATFNISSRWTHLRWTFYSWPPPPSHKLEEDEEDSLSEEEDWDTDS